MQEFAYVPAKETVENTNIFGLARKLGFTDLHDLYDFADSKPEEFWPKVIEDTGIEFFSPFSKVKESRGGVEFTKWFVGGLINAEYNCVEKHRQSGSIAIKWEIEGGKHGTISYRELDQRVGKLAGSLQNLGVKKGDRVGIYMPLCTEAIIAFYSIMRVGAVVVPIFSGYAEEAVRKRVEDAGIEFLFTYSSYSRKGKTVDMLSTVSRIHGLRLISAGPAIGDVAADSFDLLVKNGIYVQSLKTESEDPFIMLYTSGTTGKPKGTIHVHGGSFINIVKEVRYYMDARQEDTVFWITDLGWMMGPWYILGTHALGGSVFLYDGAVDYPSKDRIPDMIARHGISILGLSPTYVRMLKHSAYSRSFDGVRVFGSTGEPWDEEAWNYLFRDLGSGVTPISNISGGTDIIGCFLASTPATSLYPRCLYRGLGMNASVFNEAGIAVYDEVGYLVAKDACPSFTRGLWGQEEKYVETYWSRFKDTWFHGDWAMMSKDGYFYLFGRADDVIKVAGKRVGPNEVEDATMRVGGVRECACVGVPDDLKGEAIVIFYMGEDFPDTKAAIRKEVEKSLGKSFSPKEVLNVTSLPRTRSGKIMRRLVKNAYLGLPYGDVSNLENPEALEEIHSLRTGSS